MLNLPPGLLMKAGVKLKIHSFLVSNLCGNCDFQPAIQIKTRSGYPPFGRNFAANVLHAVADLLLVNIQSDVPMTSLLGVSESARSLSSAFVHQALLP
jgi:hypothetical protein